MTYIIGEIGINHNGCIENVKKLIDIACVSGFDAVKFQKRNPDVCVPEHQKNKIKDTPWGKMTYIDYKHNIEFGKRGYNTISRYCELKGIDWSASPWDKDSIDFLVPYNLPWVKVPSALITNHSYLKYISKNFEKIIISTGMTTENQLHESMNVLKSSGTEFKNITILHCNSTYPSPVEHLNLNYIKRLQTLYPACTIGYSGHEYGLVTTTTTIAMGAKVIERHITLDKTMWGSDQMCSLEPHAMFKLVRQIRELEQALGSSSEKENIYPGEEEKIKSLRG